MTATENYGDILNRSFDDIPESRNAPDGSWLLRGRNAAYMAGKGEDSKGSKVLFFYELKEPMTDVDEESLKALEGYDISEIDVSATFWADKNKDWDKIRKHLELHGVNTKGVPITEALKGFTGTETIGYVTTRTFTNAAGQVVEQNVASQFAPVE